MADVLPDLVTTPRLVLRAWAEDDVDVLSTAIAQSLEHLRPWMPWAASEPVERSVRQATLRRWTAERARGGDLVAGIFRDGVAVGGCGLHHRGQPEGLEVGYWVHADHVRRGYATEAAAGLTGAAFAARPIAWVEIHHDLANVASGAVPARLGFTRIRERKDHVDAPGEAGIDCTWRVTREVWEARAG